MFVLLWNFKFWTEKFFFSLYVFGEPAVHFLNFHLCCPLQRSARSQVPSEVATHQEIGSQLWAGETPDSNPGLQDNSLARYYWATTPPCIELPRLPNWATTPPLLSYHASNRKIIYIYNFCFHFGLDFVNFDQLKKFKVPKRVTGSVFKRKFDILNIFYVVKVLKK